MSTTLQIRQQGDAQFCVVRLKDGKSTTPITLSAPDVIDADDNQSSSLSADLRWYLERYLDYPFGPESDKADRILKSLNEWGTTAFKALFCDEAALWFESARTNGLEHLTVSIASEDPRVLAWPWEALADPRGTTLAHTCRVVRQLYQLRDPVPLPDLPSDRLNILMIIARPGGEADVGYHTLSRPLLELIEQQSLPIDLEVLRPPTFSALQERLQTRPGHYHIVHFDGHGGYGSNAAPAAAPYNVRSSAQGRLVFENNDGRQDLVDASALTTLLTTHATPLMLLNACRSAQIDERADDPFASVAAALLRAGIHNVVAMGYNLYVSAAKVFVPPFYQRLLQTGDVAEATRAGRRAMFNNPDRLCHYGEHPLHDWMVPVLYQQQALPLNIQTDATAIRPDPLSVLPEAARHLGDYPFIGRQSTIQKLEGALLRQPQAAILIHGMAGIGKTTLAKGFLHWLAHTHGLAEKQFVGVCWTAFDDTRSINTVINDWYAQIIGPETAATDMDTKITTLTDRLVSQRWLLIWDNFESAAGMAGTEVNAMLSEEERAVLHRLLSALRNKRTKILITSRSPEPELSEQQAFRLPLHGLAGEELWDYCQTVLRDLNLTINRDDDYAQLVDALAGHPIAIRTVLLQTRNRALPALLKDLNTALASATGDASTQRLQAAFTLLDQGMPEENHPILRIIGLHKRNIRIALLCHMLSEDGDVDTTELKTTINTCLSTLETAGLVHAITHDHYQMHPALPPTLEQQHPATEDEQRRFVDVYGTLAAKYAQQAYHEQRPVIESEGANLYTARQIAAVLQMHDDTTAITQFLALVAKYRHDWRSATNLYTEYKEHGAELGEPSRIATAYNQLGSIALSQRNFANAEDLLRQSLDINKELDNWRAVAITYHELGRVAEEQREFAKAEDWYQQSLAIKKERHDDKGMASTFNQLGTIAKNQGEFGKAENWYQQSLAIEKKLDDEYGMAISHQQLGVISEQQGDYDKSENWCLQALEIFEKIDDYQAMANTYHQLGNIAVHRSEIDIARQWHLKSLGIREKLNNPREVAISHYHLGVVCAEKEDKSTAAQYYIQALIVLVKYNDVYHTDTAVYNFRDLLEDAGDQLLAELEQRWNDAGLAELMSFDQVKNMERD